jgi:aerobic carbon-monoxide dehydrogenase medium subunit
MKPAPFEYHAPTTVAEVVGLLAELGEEAKVLAGGQSLVPMLNLRLARFEHLVDIGRVTELRGIERRNGHVSIGAATRDAVIERDPTIVTDAPLLAAATPYIGHFQIRNRGTIGGSLAHADPAAEYPAVAIALDATFHVAGAGGTRDVAAADFFTGVWSTALEPDELLTAIDVPVWSGNTGVGVAEFARRHGDFAIAGAVAAVELADDRVARAAIGVFGAAGVPVRATAAEQALTGQLVGAVGDAELGELAFAGIDDVADDPQVPASYRRRVGVAMVAEAWRRAVADAQDGARDG